MVSFFHSLYKCLFLWIFALFNLVFLSLRCLDLRLELRSGDFDRVMILVLFLKDSFHYLPIDISVVLKFHVEAAVLGDGKSNGIVGS